MNNAVGQKTPPPQGGKHGVLQHGRRRGCACPPGRQLSLRCGHSRGFCGTPRSTLWTSCRTCRSSMCLCRSWETRWWNSCRRATRPRLLSRLSPCPRSLWTRIPQRSACRRPRRAEQLVEVPTIVSSSSLQQQTAEQIIDIPVPHGRAGQAGLQGFSQGQGSAAFSGADLVDIPVPRGGGSSRTSFYCFILALHQVPWMRLFHVGFRTFPQSQKSARLGPHSGSELGADFNPRTPAACGDSMALEEDELETGSESESEVEEDAGTRFGAGIWPLRVCIRFLELYVGRPVRGCA